jgi:transposase
LAVRVALRRQFDRFEKQVPAIARSVPGARLLTSVPGVGAIASLTLAAAIDDPARFKSSIIEASRSLFRPDTNQIPIGRDGHRRPHIENR